ncbi:hypothetical protein [Gimesia maris]|uniref:hypothetical protein n=1 Tax=Gimesia maris TaxID=122 RepID=UPI0032EAF34F
MRGWYLKIAKWIANRNGIDASQLMEEHVIRLDPGQVGWFDPSKEQLRIEEVPKPATYEKMKELIEQTATYRAVDGREWTANRDEE